MKKRMTVFLLTCLVFMLALPTIHAQQGQQEMTFDVLKEDSDELSAASRYMNNPAIITVENGITYATITLNHSHWWQSLKVQAEQPGTFADDHFVEAEVLSEDEEANERVVKFAIADIEQALNAQIHIIVTGVPNLGAYDMKHNIRLKFNSERETPAEQAAIADGHYTIDFAILHEEEDRPSSMSRYIATPASLLVENGTNTVTMTLLNHEQITALQIEQDGTFVDTDVVNIDEVANERVVSFAVTDLAEIVPAKVQVYVAAQNYTGNHVIRFAFDLTSLEIVAAEDSAFADIKASWAKPYIEALASEGIVKGMTEHEFAPMNDITRAQFAVMLSRALDLPTEPFAGQFDDVAESLTWAALDIEAAHRAGIVEGTSADTFHPDDPITRQQMVAMIIRAIEVNDAHILEGVESDLEFADAAAIAAGAKPYVEQAVGLNIIAGMEQQGDIIFAPEAHATRAEAAKVIYYLLDILAQ